MILRRTAALTGNGAVPKAPLVMTGPLGWGSRAEGAVRKPPPPAATLLGHQRGHLPTTPGPAASCSTDIRQRTVLGAPVTADSGMEERGSLRHKREPPF